MVILGVNVMARRRKGAGGNKAASKATGRNAKKVNGVPEDKPNGSLIPHMVVESEESCISQDENRLPLSCKTPVDMCTGDPNLGEPPPMAPFTVHSVPHKKFGKFRCLLENTETVQNQNCMDMEKTENISDSPAQEVIEQVDGEVIIEHEAVDIGEAQEVVWEEEVVEETVVCEDMEIELEEATSQDCAQVLEEGDSQESDFDHMNEVKENDFSSHDDQVVIVGGCELDSQEMDAQSTSSVSERHSMLVVKEICFENSNLHNSVIHSRKEKLSPYKEIQNKDSSRVLIGNVKKCKEESAIPPIGVKMDVSNLSPVSERSSALIPGCYSSRKKKSEPTVVEMEVPCGKDVSRVLCSQENISSLRDCNESSEHNKCCKNESISPRHAKNMRVKDSEYCVDNFQSIKEEEIKVSNCSFSVNNENLKKVKLMFGSDCGQFPTEDAVGRQRETFVLGNSAVPLQNIDIKEEGNEKQDTILQALHVVEDSAQSSNDDLERKNSASNFRNRSGSTDTTGSESGSSCSTGVRRSNRIRSIGLLKQRNRKRSEPDPVPVVSESENSVVKLGEAQEIVDSMSEVLKDNVDVKMSAPTSCSVTNPVPSVVPYDVDITKPVKVKSRWRRSSELEMVGNRNSDSDMTTPPNPSISPRPIPPLLHNVCPKPLIPSMMPPNRTSVLSVPTSTLPGVPEVSEETEIGIEEQEKREDDERERQERLNSFVNLLENEYLTDRSTSKEAKRMVCDCSLSKEEILRGDTGCGEDCLNRLLMIECGSRCTVGDRCTNKRFQRQDYAKCEIFKTVKKGFGLRTLCDLPVGTFVMEYVGEVVDQKEFRRRAKDYAKDKNRHYYFMALKSDAIIDATMKGNISRFINHSCDPNAETQKWTVNGELRIGFFSKRLIQAGEEVTFDYQFQRYGKEAQRCFCETPNCRGWIGEDPEKEKRDRKERKERELKKKREEKRKDVKEFLDDMDLEEEIEKLSASGLKNRTHTLTLCRLMVRAEDRDSRIQLLKLIQEGEQACRRLFLDYHGLRLIWSWMMDVGSGLSDDEQELRIEILKTLSELPIPNKTVLQDSKVMTMVEKWLGLNASADITCLDEKKDSHVQDDESGSDQDASKPRVDNLIPPIEMADDDTQQGLENEKQLVDGTSELTSRDALALGQRGSESDEETEESSVDRRQAFTELASRLVGEWNSLKEVFRIPKKERLEQMKEHEREADRGYKEYLDKEGNQDIKQSYDRHWRFRNEEKRERKRTKESPDCDRNRKGCRYEDRNLVPVPRMSKHERRQLFALKVAQEEEERRQQQELWRQHEDQCLALGMDPSVTAAFDPQTGFPCFFDPTTGTWQSFPPQDPSSLPPPEMVPSPLFNPSNPHHIPAISNTSVPPPVVPHIPPHGVPHGVPPPHGPPPHGVPPSLGVPPHGPPPTHSGPPPHVPPSLGPHGAPPPHTLPHVPTHGPPPHRMPPPHGVPTPIQISQSNYETNNPSVPYDPNNPLSHTSVPPPLAQQPSSTTHPGTYNDPRPTSLEPPGAVPEILPMGSQSVPLGSQTQPLYQQPPPTQQHIYAPQQTVEPQGVPQPQFHQVLPTAQLPYMQPVPSLPPKWKSARDSEGRVYYYHVKTRVSQWEPPQWTQVDQQPESESSSDTSEDEDDEEEEEESSSTEEDEEGEQEDKPEDEDEEEEEEETGEEKEDREDEDAKESDCVNKGESSFSLQEARPSIPEEVLSKPLHEEPKRKERRREGLVQERIISPRREEDRTDSKKYKEIKEKLRRKKEILRARERAERSERSERSKKRHRERLQRSSSRTVERPVTVAADTSSDAARKIKDQFRLQMAGVIVQNLNPYRKPDCKAGRIVNTEDFKHLARKLTHFVMLKELKHCRSVEDLECNDNVKHKARDFVKKYMAKFGSVYQRPKDDD